MKKQTMLIKAVKTDAGYILIAENGDRPQEGFAHPTAAAAYADAAQMYPPNSVWRGNRVSGGYRIEIETD